jgi:hypothetical protein
MLKALTAQQAATMAYCRQNILDGPVAVGYEARGSSEANATSHEARWRL